MFDINILINWFYLFIVYLGFRLSDYLTSEFFHFVIFGALWNKITMIMKQYRVKNKIIKTDMIYSLSYVDVNLESSKKLITRELLNLKNNSGKNIELSELTWNNSNEMMKTNITYESIIYPIQISFKMKYYGDGPYSENKETNGLIFKIGNEFKYKDASDYLSSLLSLTVLINKNLENSFNIINYSKGKLALSQIKTNIKLNELVNSSDFNISLNISSKDNIIINLNKYNADIIFPSLIIDHIVIKYLKNLILNYYM